jgi:hypothetical protein
MSTNLQTIQAILLQQPQVGRPSQTVCASIAGLKDLCDLNGMAAAADWRRATPTMIQSRGGRPVFRNLNAGGSSPANSPSMHKSNSNRSFTANSGGASPVGTPYSPLASSGSYSPPVRYQSKFKNTSQPVEDKILNNIILSKLNKFSSATYSDVRDFLYQILGSGEPDLGEMVRQFMMMVFKKAAAEEVYCALYAKLLAEISTRYKVILEEMHTLQRNYLEIFDEVEEVPEGGDNYDAFVEKNKEKRYRQGYSQFIAELAALEIMELSNLEQTVKKLTDLMLKYVALPDSKTLVEEYADCLIRMSRVLKKKSLPFFVSARASLLSISKNSIDAMLAQKDTFPSLSSKARFILMDIKDNLTA